MAVVQMIVATVLAAALFPLLLALVRPGVFRWVNAREASIYMRIVWGKVRPGQWA